MDILLHEWADSTELLDCDNCNGGTPHLQQQVLHAFSAHVAEVLMECCRCGEHRTWISA